MNLSNYLEAGFRRAIKKFKLAVYLWVAIFILALVAITPVSSLIRSQLGNLYLPENPLLPFELNLVEIFLANQAFFGPYLALLLTIILVAVPIFIFLEAGLFGRLLEAENRVNLNDFMADGSRYFWKFFLSLVAFIPFLLIFFLLFRLLTAPLTFWSSRASTEWPVIIAANLKMILLILLWSAFKLLLDLVRIIIVTENRKVIPAYASSLGFLKRHFFTLWGIYLLLGLTVVGISAVWLIIVRLFSSTHLPGVLIVFLLGQAYLLFRLLATLIFIGVEYSYYSSRRILE